MSTKYKFIFRIFATTNVIQSNLISLPRNVTICFSTVRTMLSDQVCTAQETSETEGSFGQYQKVYSKKGRGAETKGVGRETKEGGECERKRTGLQLHMCVQMQCLRHVIFKHPPIFNKLLGVFPESLIFARSQSSKSNK